MIRVNKIIFAIAFTSLLYVWFLWPIRSAGIQDCDFFTHIKGCDYEIKTLLSRSALVLTWTIIMMFLFRKKQRSK